MPYAIWNGAVVADAPDDQVEIVEGNVYFPRSAVKMDLLRESTTETVCGWKGTANYYDVVVDGRVNKDAAWYYADPKPEAQQIADRVAFWKGVSIFR